MLFLKLLAIVGTAGIACSFLCLIALHLLPTPVNPIRDAICDHASYRYGFLFNMQSGATGVGGLCLLAGFVLSGRSAPRFGVIALTVFALSRLALIFFPSDVKPPRTLRGTAHMVLDVLMFAAISLGTAFLSYPYAGMRFPGTAGWTRASFMLLMSAGLTELCATLTIFTVSVPALRRFMGLNERFLYLGILLWFGAAFIPFIDGRSPW